MLICQGKLVAEKEMTKVLSSAQTKVEGMVGKITQVKAARGVARVAVPSTPLSTPAVRSTPVTVAATSEPIPMPVVIAPTGN